MAYFIQVVLSGLLLGALYATSALGFSIIWGVMRLINLAHGEFLMMGAFVAWFFYNPTRDQDLVFTVENSWVAVIALVGLLNVIGFTSVYNILGVEIESIWKRRGLVVLSSTGSALAIFSLWSGTDFTPVTISMMALVFGGLALSIGFIISHIILSVTLDWGTLTLRRLIGYPLGALIAGILHLAWQANGYPSIDPFGNLALVVFAGMPFVMGFFLGEWLFGEILSWENVLQRRLVGFIIGAIASVLLYQVWLAADFPPISLFGSLPILFILFFALGYVIQNGFFNRLLGGPYLSMLLVTFAVAIVMQDLGLSIYKADPRRINLDYGNAIKLAESILVSPIRILIVVTSVIMIGGLVIFLRYTRTGYAIRAAGQNEMAARLMGINIREVYAITFAISLGLTAMAGAMMGAIQPISPVDGPAWTIRAFTIVALGGLGKIEGVVIGGLVLGMAESLVGGYVNTSWSVAMAFILLVFMLLVRPQGLTGGLSSGEG